MADKRNQLLPPLRSRVKSLEAEFQLIPGDRRVILLELTEFVKRRVSLGQEVNLNFICTHNSRRSQIAQLWAQAAAHFYAVPAVNCFSGGTEATTFNLRAVGAMRVAGFGITEVEQGANPHYQASFALEARPLVVFSKKYDDPFNAGKDFAAIMVCAHADAQCPFVVGASTRMALAYEDPKDFDGTSRESEKYTERVNQIGREMLFAFSNVGSVTPMAQLNYQ